MLDLIKASRFNAGLKGVHLFKICVRALVKQFPLV